jgi:hypothetical protein
MSESVLNIGVNSLSPKEMDQLAAMKIHSTCEPKHQVMALHRLTSALSRKVSLILRGHVSTKMKLSFIRNRMSVELISSAYTSQKFQNYVLFHSL